MKTLSVLLFILHLSAVFLFPDGINNLQPSENGKIWAVLVAGSNDWGNYRHQADICHAYQILHKHGVPDERIIVMMYNDIANNEKNPTPGIIINHPNGKDVYHGVPHDYTEECVTAENFMAILKGGKNVTRNGESSKCGGKVLKSGPNDDVFIYFADHGAAGLIAFPSSVLLEKQLIETIKFMNENKMYGKMVIYIEACESGSMFAHLPDHINVYATTAASPTESSFACYFDSCRNTYLGDVYSVKWMEDSDKEDLHKETLEQQYKIVKEETETSHVQQYGEMKVSDMHVSEFQGRKQIAPIILPKAEVDAIDSREVHIEIFRRKLLKFQGDEAEKEKLQKEFEEALKNRKFVRDTVYTIALKSVGSEKDAEVMMNTHKDVRNVDCYEEVINYFKDQCFNLAKNTYVLGFMHVLQNLCEYGILASAQKEIMETVCTHEPMYGIH